MFKRLFLGIGLVAMVLIHAAQAQTVSGRFEAYVSTASLGISRSSFQMDASPGIQIAPIPNQPWLQLGGEVSFQRLEFREGVTRSTLFLAGVTANVGPNPADAAFVSIGGAYRGGVTDVIDPLSPDPTGKGFYFITGKRFQLSGGISIRSYLGVVSCGTTGMVFRPLGLSYMF